MRRGVLIALVVAGCGSDVQSPSELDHDRIIAVRATPPHIRAGEHATLDLLLGFSEQPVAEQAPDEAWVISPKSLEHAVAADGKRWIVTAPSEDALAAARAELKLAPTDPVPLHIGVRVRWPYPITSPDGETFTATKIVYLGDTGANPDLTSMPMLVNNAAAVDTPELVVPKNLDVPLFIQADDTVEIVSWLSSCGHVHGWNLHDAYLVVTPDSPQEGELALVYRDGKGGVAWHVWPIHAE